jgi:oxygen-dependent protoporphyrinogen oxidase
MSNITLTFNRLLTADTTQNEPSTQTENFDLVISTLRSKDLTPYVTVMTVNLYYSNPSLLPYEGFGYLIPQSVPFEENPERALGVIFDSCAINGQDSVDGTKLTVMMGGHWWNDWAGYPDEEEGLEMAKAVVQRHLNITEAPTAAHVNLSKDCIPQYTLGYEDRLQDFARGITDEFKGRLRVVGNQFNGVGVNDCITGAWNLARGLRDGGWKSRSCGLDRVMDGRQWQVVEASEMAYQKKEYVRS